MTGSSISAEEETRLQLAQLQLQEDIPNDNAEGPSELDPDLILVRGIPDCYIYGLVRELLGTFEPFRHFDAVRDEKTGKRKVYCAYQDPLDTDVACHYVNGGVLYGKVVSAGRANGASPPNREQMSDMILAHQKKYRERPLYYGKVICLEGLVNRNEDLEVPKQEGRKCGDLVKVAIPPGGEKALLEYTSAESASRALSILHGRGVPTAMAKFYPELEMDFCKVHYTA